VPGDTFVFAGRLLRFEGVRELGPVLAGNQGDPKIPAYGGGRLPLSTFLADRVRGILQDPSRHPKLPARSARVAQHPALALGPAAGGPAANRGLSTRSKQFIVAYCFEAGTRIRRWACC